MTTASRAESPAQDRTRRPGSWVLPRLPGLVLTLALVGQAVLVLSRVRHGWFGGDAIHYLAQRGGVGAPSEALWEPSAGHLRATVLVGYRLLYEMFGFDTYLPYVLPVVVTHLAICALLYRLCTRLGAHRWAASVGVLALAFFGAGAETYLADSMIAHSATILLAVIALLVLERGDFSTRALVKAAALLAFAFTFSVAAVPAAVCLAMFTWQRRGWRPGLAVVAVPLLLFAAWFLAVGRDSGRVAADDGLVWDVPERALTLLFAPLSAISSTPSGGALLTVLVMLAPLLVRTASRPLRDLAVAGILAALAQSLLSALVSLGMDDGYVLGGRYQYLVLAYLLPAVILALGGVFAAVSARSGELHPLAAPAVALALVVLVVGKGLGDQQQAWNLTRTDQAVKARAWTTGGVAAAALGERMLSPDAGSYTAHGHDIVTLAKAGAAQWPALTATPEDRLEAESVYFTGVGAETYDLPGPPRLHSSSFDKRLRPGAGCQEVTATEDRPQLTFSSFNGAQIAVESQSSVVSMVLVREGEQTEARDYGVTPGSVAFVGTTAQVATVRLVFDSGGDFTICAADPV